MTPKDIEIIEMPPPDMPAALYAKAVDAYCTVNRSAPPHNAPDMHALA